jgi:peptidyl-prolyl cis-trans isomerase A (cyclophilin A)
MTPRSALTAFLLAALFAGAASAQTAVPSDLPEAPGISANGPHPQPVPTNPTIVIDTTLGRLTCKTFPQLAPLAVANFTGLAEGTKDWTDNATHIKQQNHRFYDGLAFHRVIPSFMVQAGDPAGDGSGDPGYYFPDEINPALTFSVPGRLAMANSGPNTNGSQFFITVSPVPELNGHYTIFGQCDAASVALVQTIARVPRDHNDKPLTPILITRVAIVRDNQPLPPAPPIAPSPTSAPTPPPAP